MNDSKAIKWYYAAPTVSRPIPAFMCSDGIYYCAFSCEETIETIETVVPKMITAVLERRITDE